MHVNDEHRTLINMTCQLIIFQKLYFDHSQNIHLRCQQLKCAPKEQMYGEEGEVMLVIKFCLMFIEVTFVSNIGRHFLFD